MNQKTTVLNLEFLASKLLNSQNIQSQSKDRTLEFTSNKLSSKFPELKTIDDIVLIAIHNRDRRCLTLYRNQNAFIAIAPDINGTEMEVEILSWQAGDINQAIVAIDDVQLQIPVAFNRYFLDEVQSEFNNCLEGDRESLNLDWLREAPNIELKLAVLPFETEFLITNKDKRSRKYATLMVDLEAPDGKSFKNVLTNRELRNLIYNECDRFKIVGTEDIAIAINEKETRNVQKVLVEPVGIDTSFEKIEF